MDEGRIIGGRYIRCTKFLKYFDPYGGGDGLLRWAFNQGDTFEKYEEALNECAENGTLMHDEIEGYFKTGEFTEGRKYLPEGWDNFVDKYRPEMIYGEERFYDNNLMVTGQPDFVGYIDWKGQRIRAVVDWKSSKKPSMKHKIQASIYSMNCSIDEQPIEGALVVAFGASTKQGFSVGYVSREQIESNYLAMEHIKKAMECVGVYVDEYY
jgi:predicted RecB family nuclease